MANKETPLTIQSFHQCSSLITIKLNTSNFLLWRSQVSSLVRSLGLSHHLEENSKPAKETTGDDDKVQQNPLHDIWMRNDGLLNTWLLGIIGDKVIGMLEGMDNAYQVWKSVEENILPITKDKEIHLTQSFMTIQKGSMSLDEYIKKFKAICDSLATVQKPVDEVTKVFHLARGLGEDEEGVVVVDSNQEEEALHLLDVFLLLLRAVTLTKTTLPSGITTKDNKERSLLSHVKSAGRPITQPLIVRTGLITLTNHKTYQKHLLPCN
ncbi:hypothetical protein Q3G72_012789 [Acer saccharum]|nr:hypothetical protein Q3G72_012789 [Acer saccharum]